MRELLIIFTMLGAFVLEWILNAMTAGTLVFVPLSVLVFCMWSWRMEFETRMWFALTTGFVMDTMRLVPFGASILTCLLLALLCEVFKLFFSPTDSPVTQGVSIVLLITVSFGALPFFGFLLNR